MPSPDILTLFRLNPTNQQGIRMSQQNDQVAQYPKRMLDIRYIVRSDGLCECSDREYKSYQLTSQDFTDCPGLGSISINDPRLAAYEKAPSEWHENPCGKRKIYKIKSASISYQWY